MKLPLQPYKGARDFYPEDKRKQDYMFSVLKDTVTSFGYEEYNAPILEPLELYLAKSGEEIVNEQTYTFTDRGGRQVAIRPEMTPTVSRMVASKRQELAYPLRWFSIPNLWRYERPQRGRYREHWQLNVDLFGVNSNQAEIELITIASCIYKAFKATPDMFLIKINNRAMMDFIFNNYLNLSIEQTYSLAKLIDKRAKLDKVTFLDALDNLLTPKQKEAGVSEKLIDVLSVKSIDDIPKEIKLHESFTKVTESIKACNEAGINNIVFDINLMRGFDYYNGIVFEIFDTHPDNNRSMMGGGRYDGLVGLFGVEPIPTVGFGLGDATLSNFLELHNLVPNIKSETDLYLIPLGDSLNQTQKIANSLREKNINVALDLSDSNKKIGYKINIAAKKQIKYILVIGEQELKTKHFKLKDINSSEEYTGSLEKITEHILKNRSL